MRRLLALLLIACLWTHCVVSFDYVAKHKVDDDDDEEVAAPKTQKMPTNNMKAAEKEETPKAPPAKAATEEKKVEKAAPEAPSKPAAKKEEVHESSSFPLEHDLGNGKFKPRGKISVETIGTRVNIKAHQQEMTVEEQQQLQALADAGGYYRVRLSSASGSGRHAVGSIPACAVVNANLYDRIVIQGDSTFSFVGIDYFSGNSTCGDAPLRLKSKQWSTQVSFMMGAELPRPYVEAADIPAPGSPPAGTPPPPQGIMGILSRYWMYLLPLAFVLFSSFGGGGGEEGQEGEQGAAQGGRGGGGGGAQRRR